MSKITSYFMRFIGSFRSAVQKIKSTKSFYKINLYYRQRGLNFYLFLVSIVTTGILILTLCKSFTYEIPKTKISLVLSNSEIRISEMSVHIYYQTNSVDYIDIHMTVYNPAGSLNGEYLILNTSKNLKLEKREYDSWESYSSEQFRYSGHDDEHFYKSIVDFNDEQYIAFHERFSGNVFGNSETEINLDFDLSSCYEELLPLKVYVFHLDKTNIGDISPHPYSDDNYLEYRFYSFQENYDHFIKDGISIRLNAIDRQASYKAQFKSFIIGVAIALFSSVAVNLFTDFSSYPFPDNREDSIDEK